MSLRLPSSVFVHVPRTGGLWFGSVVDRLGLLRQRLKGDVDSHLTAEQLTQIGWTDPSFGFIRHPLSWVKSRWSHAVEIRARENRRHFGVHLLFDECVRDTFADTLRSIILHRPGIVGHTYHEMLTGTARVYRTEDFPYAAETAITDFEKTDANVLQVIEETDSYNGTSTMDKYLSQIDAADPVLIEDFLGSEQETIRWWRSLNPARKTLIFNASKEQ